MLAPYVAFLRVYEPIRCFDVDSQAKWSEITSDAPTRKEEQEKTIENLVFPNRIGSVSEGAHIIERDGERFICPWSLKSRTAKSLQIFVDSNPSSLIKFFIPPDLEKSVEEISQLDSRIPHVLSERWIIPPRWFALFRPGEQLLKILDSEVTCIYRTEISKAKARCLEAHTVVRDSFGNGEIESEIAELLKWLGIFHENSLVELDYGGLAFLMESMKRLDGGDGIQEDTSLEDVLESISGLGRKDGVQAGEAYGRLMSRWRRVSILEQAH
jgi:hypothetical protein